MEHIKFDEGYKEFAINDDENRVIRFNPGDYSILERLHNAQEHFKDIAKSIEEKDGTDSIEGAVDLLKLANEKLKAETDYIFGYPVADVLFGVQSPLTPIKGETLFERVIDAILPIVEKEVEISQKKSRKKIEKYTKEYKK